MMMRLFYNNNQPMSSNSFGNIVTFSSQGNSPANISAASPGSGNPQANAGGNASGLSGVSDEQLRSAAINHRRNRINNAFLRMKRQLAIVQVCSLLSATLVISQNLAILFLFRRAGWVVSLFLSLLIPYFGFEGARTRSVRLLSAYYIFNIASLIMFLIVSILQFESLQSLLDEEDISRATREMTTNYVITNFVFGLVIAICQIIGLIASRNLIKYHLTPNPFSRRSTFRTTLELQGAQGNYATERRAGLSDEFIKSMPTTIITPDWKEIEKQPICPICQDDYQMEDIVKTLPCRHCFHGKCIDQWLPKSENCPMCNQNVLELSSRPAGLITQISTQVNVPNSTIENAPQLVTPQQIPLQLDVENRDGNQTGNETVNERPSNS